MQPTLMYAREELADLYGALGKTEDRLEIVIAWAQRLEAADDLTGIEDKLSQLQRLRAELQQSPD